MELPPKTNRYVVAALYQFVSVDDCAGWQAKLKEICRSRHLMGTLLIAPEGLNGTVAGRYDDINNFVQWLGTKTPFTGLEIKYALHDDAPFHRMKVRLKREIVTMGEPDIRPSEQAGNYVAPEDWNALISDPDVLVVDTRNHYETAIGQFRGATDPHTTTFREFPAWAKALAEKPEDERPRKIAMYCTGGIRCEKSTSYMKSIGFDEVYHLKGGILKYLEDIPQDSSLWDGECFVFDSRVSVDHALNQGSYQLCHACKMPLSEDEMRAAHYVPGISCPHCHDLTTDAQRQRFAERARQIELARQRGTQHIGAKASQPKPPKNVQKDPQENPQKNPGER